MSAEIVGRASVGRELRGAGRQVLIAATAGQALRRLACADARFETVVVVGTLPDGGARALQRWLREHGPADTPLIGIGTGLDADPRAVEIDAQAWAADPGILRALLDRLADRGRIR